MYKFFCILIINYSLLITNCYPQWQVVSTQGNEAVSFSSVNTGFSTSNGTTRKTINGGDNWVVQTTGSSVELWSIDFVNDTLGYAIGSNAVLKTTNGGITFINNNNNSLPTDYELYQNYPNPFNPVTTIEFLINKPAFVSITIYNSLGNEIKKIVNGNKLAGTYSIDFDASNLSSGVYFYSLNIDERNVSTRKMLLLK